MRKILLIIVIAFTAFSCISADDVQLQGLHKINISEGSNVETLIKIENNSTFKITVKELDLKIQQGGRDFLKLVLKDNVSIPRKSDDIVAANFAYKFSNPLALLALMGKKASYSGLINSLELEGKITARAGLVTKTYYLEKVSLQQVFKEFNLDFNDILKNL